MFENLIAKIIGKSIAEKLNLREGYMPTQPWYTSKTIWSDIVTILMALYTTFQSTIAVHTGINVPVIPTWVFTILGAIGIYGRSTATTTIGS